MESLVGGLVRLYERLVPVSLITLLARLLVGLVFFRSGMTKIEGFEIKPATFFLFENEYKIRIFEYLGLSDKVYSLPFADVAAVLGTASELTMPILLWLGLGARFAATVLLGMTLVIQLVYPNAYLDHGLWAVGLLIVMAYGAGRFSLDYFIRRSKMAG